MSLLFNMLFRFVIAFLQSCITFCDPIECSPPGFSVHMILQARILEWGAGSSSGPVPITQPSPLCPCTVEWSLRHAAASRATLAHEGHLAIGTDETELSAPEEDQ